MSETKSPANLASGARRAAAPEELLFYGSPTEVLARIVSGDPLGLRPRLGATLRRCALLVDAERTFVTLCALVAYRAPLWRGRPRLARWLDARVEEALELALAELEVAPGGSAGPDVFELVAAPLGLEPGGLRRASAAFNRLEPSAREAFFRVALEQADLEATARDLGLSLPELARRARAAKELLLELVPAPAPLHAGLARRARRP